MSLASVVYCQVEFSVVGQSVFQRSTTVCRVSGNYMRLLSTLLASSKSTIHAYYMQE
jgi:hypothetical protein